MKNIKIKDIKMQKAILVSNRSLRTALWTGLIVALMGVTACSGETEEAEVDSEEVVVDQSDDTTQLADNDISETDSASADEPETDSAENTNADKTAADGLQ